MGQGLYDDSILKATADIVYESSGIVFKDSNLTVLSSRLSAKLKEKSISASEYLILLKKDKNELLSFIDFVTTNFTSFFRNPKQFETLREFALPEIVKRNTASKFMKLWSAACSTGEEPYTMAMVTQDFMDEKGLSYQNWGYHITCSDISLESLFIAKEGKFPSKSVQKIEKHYLDKYLECFDEYCFIKPELKKNIQFDFHNLIYDNGIRDVDIAFCRNVLIYFDEDIQKKVLANIFQSMKQGGFLFIGHSESLIGLYEGFKPMTTEKGIVYVKQ